MAGKSSWFHQNGQIKLKRILGPKGAFKNRTSAYRTLKGMEAMHSLRKGQGAMFAYGQPNPDAVIVSRVFEGCLRTPTRSEHQRMKTGSSRLSA